MCLRILHVFSKLMTLTELQISFDHFAINISNLTAAAYDYIQEVIILLSYLEYRADYLEVFIFH